MEKVKRFLKGADVEQQPPRQQVQAHPQVGRRRRKSRAKRGEHGYVENLQKQWNFPIFSFFFSHYHTVEVSREPAAIAREVVAMPIYQAQSSILIRLR